MTKKKKKHKSVIFISRSYSVELLEKTDVVLSPEFYWVVQKKLPIKYIWQAKKLAPSVFDGLLPPEGEYQFHAIYEEGFFYLFAYDNNYIMNHLKKIVNNIDLIDNIYFAQTELSKQCAYTCGNKILYAQNNTFVLLPATLIEKKDISIKELHFEKLSRHKISLDTYSSLIDKKSFNLIVILLMILISFNMIESFYYKNNLSKLQMQLKSLAATYQLPSTSWQIDAIKKRISDKNFTQLTLRKNIYKVFDLRLKEDEFITHLSFEKSGIALMFSLKEAIRAEDLKKELIEKGFKVKNAKVNDLLFTIELAYE